MTSSFCLRIKSARLAQCMFLCSLLVVPGCTKKVESVTSSGTAQATVQYIQHTPKAPAGAQGVVAAHGGSAIPNVPGGNQNRPPQGTIPTNTRPDLSKMPNDDVHARFRRPPSMGPHGMARPGMKAGAAAAETDNHPTHPLVKTGPRSVTELNERLAKESDKALKERLEKGFRLTFATNKNRATAMEAGQVLNGIDKGTSGATAYRVLAYVSILTGGGFKRSQEYYAKAVSLDPSYGAAHYGLAFSLLASPTPEMKARGRSHFDTAMKLGVEDTNRLRARFYPTTR